MKVEEKGLFGSVDDKTVERARGKGASKPLCPPAGSLCLPLVLPWSGLWHWDPETKRGQNRFYRSFAAFGLFIKWQLPPLPRRINRVVAHPALFPRVT